MSSTFSTNLKLNLIDTGTDAGLWGEITNTNLGTALEQSIVGVATVNFATDANTTITLADSESSQTARNVVLRLTSSGSLTATRDLIIPALKKNYIVKNGTTGAQSIRVINTGGAGTTVTIPNGSTALIYNDGTNVVQGFDYFTTLSVASLTPTTVTGGTFSTPVQVDGTISGAVQVGGTLLNGTYSSPTQVGATINSSVSNSLTNNQPLTKGERIVVSALGTLTTGTTTIDLSTAQSFTATITASNTITFAFSNAPAADQSQVVILRLTNAGSGTIVWPANTKFPDGDETLGGLTASGVDMLGIYYDVTTTSYMVFPVGLNMAV